MRRRWWLGPEGCRLICWAAAVALLAIALWAPRHPLAPTEGAATLAVIDVSQSMDVADQFEDGRPVSRLAFARDALAALVADLPCGASLGLGLFVEHRSLLLFAPVEVCDNRGDLLGAIANLDTRLAWNGNSEIAKGYNAAWLLARDRPERPALVFITDGHEAPPVNPRHRPAFPGEIGELRVLVAGVGGDQPRPIPRHDPSGRPLGFWGADDVMQTDPYSVSRSSGSNDMLVETGSLRPGDERAAGTPGREHLSQIREDYLRLLADETGARFVRLKTVPDLTQAVNQLHGIVALQPVWTRRTWLIVSALTLVLAGLLLGWLPPRLAHRPQPAKRATMARPRAAPPPAPGNGSSTGPDRRADGRTVAAGDGVPAGG